MRLASASVPSRNVLMNTILFVLYELMQNQNQGADALMISGMVLLKDQLRISRPPECNSTAIAARLDDTGIDEAESLLTRMASHNPLGTAFPPTLQEFAQSLLSRGMHTPIPDYSCPVDEVLRIWDTTTSRIFLWINRGSAANLPHSLRKTLTDGEQQMRWRDLLLAKLRDNATTPPQKSSLRIILAGLRLSPMLVVCQQDTTEMAWEVYQDDCEAALDLLESVSADGYCSDIMGMIFDDKLLYLARLIALKCRRRNVRERALDLLTASVESADCRVLDGEAQVAACRTLVDAEEAARDWSGWISSEARFRSVSWTWDGDDAEELHVKLERARPAKHSTPKVQVVHVRWGDIS